MANWNYANAARCIGVHDILRKIYDVLGYLPDQKTPDTLEEEGVTANHLLDFGQMVADDEELWKKLPEQVTPSDVKRQRVAEVMHDFAKMAATSKMKKPPTVEDLAPIAVQVFKGISRNKLRQDLRRVLDECR